MTAKEREIVERLNHPVYTTNFLEEWIQRKDNVFINAPAALQAMGAKGFYEAVKQIAQIFECEMEYKEIVTALTGENRRKEHGNRIQRHGRTKQEQQGRS